jgi:hypothetical protein
MCRVPLLCEISELEFEGHRQFSGNGFPILLDNPAEVDRSVVMGGIHGGKYLGGGCVDDGPDAWAVRPTKDGSKLHDDMGESRVDFNRKDLASWGISGGQHLCVR